MMKYCEIYLDSNLNKPVLVDLVAKWCGGAIVDRRTISVAWGEIGVENNIFFDEANKQKSDGFIHFRYRLEAEKAPDAGDEAFVAAIESLLNQLWNLGDQAVAACDFEDRLPRNGGFFNGSIVK